MDNPDDLITIYEAENGTEAHLVKNHLIDEGIEAAVTGDHDPLALSITSPEVLVHRRDEARARELVDKYDEEQERRATRADWICPKCGAKVIGAFDLCDACGADRPGTEDD